MIRFKAANAADVPTPPAGYVTLFADTQTGLPVLKTAAGIVEQLKGAQGDPGVGLPAGGEPGDVVTKTEGGVEWAPPATEGDGEGVKTWVNMTPPDGGAEDIEGTPLTIARHSQELLPGGSALIKLYASENPQRQQRSIRGSAVVTLDVILSDPEASPYDSAALTFFRGGAPIGVFELQPGVNSVTLSEVATPGAVTGDIVTCEVSISANENTLSAWCDIEVTSFECSVGAVGEVQLTPLTVSPITVMGRGNGGGGGGVIDKTGNVASVATINVTGFYSTDASLLAGVEGIYAPRWLNQDEYTELATPVEIPFSDGLWGWGGGGCPIPGFPSGGAFLCNVTLDGATPVLALLFNLVGI